MNFLHGVGAFIAGLGITLSGLFGYHAEAPAPIVGAALPQAVAVFETSLASPVTSSATSLTLTANAIRGGGALAGYNCFTIDEGTASAETVCGTVSGTSVTGMARGISQSTGTTTVAALQFAHRRGANVKITDYPVIQILKAQNNGEETFPNILNYTSHPTFVSTTNIVDKKYVDDTAFSGAGVVDATTLARGVSELATGPEAAASTAQGSSGVLVIPASLATSTYNAATAANRAIVTGLNGRIDNGFINPYASTTLAASSTALFTLHGLPYNFPSVRGASSTALMEDGSGNLTWNSAGIGLNASSTLVVPSTATTTAYLLSVPANTLSTGNAITVRLFFTDLQIVNSATHYIDIAYGNATTSMQLTNSSGGTIPSSGSLPGTLDVTLKANGSTGSQKIFARLVAEANAVSAAAFSNIRNSTAATFSVDSTALQTLRVDIRQSSVSGSSVTQGISVTSLIKL